MMPAATKGVRGGGWAQAARLQGGTDDHRGHPALWWGAPSPWMLYNMQEQIWPCTS